MVNWVHLILLMVIVIVVVALVWRMTTLSRPFAGVKVDEVEGGGTRSKLRVKNLKKYPRSRSEAAVIKYLEEITGDKFPTAYPKWLIWKGKNLELDGFNGKIALEFSGPWHTKWIPGQESYAEYFERIVRDVVKRRLCKRHDVPLIVIDASLPWQHWRNYLLSRLFDIGVVTERPTQYIDEQTAEPFRNEQLEKELGIAHEYTIASRL